MKTFHKVLAMILSLVMLLSVVPVAVFAAEPTGDVNPETSEQVILGTGADGTITLKLNADALVTALKGEKSLEALVALLKDAIDRSEPDTITKADLLELIPVDGIFTALKDNTDDETFAKVMKEILAVVKSEDLTDFATNLPAGALDEEAIVTFITDKLVFDNEGYPESTAPIEKYFPEGLFDSTDLEGELIDYVKLDVVFAEIDVTEVINIDVLGAGEYVDLIKLVGVRNLIKILADDTKALVSKAQLMAVVQVVAYDLINNVDFVAINGYVVAEEDNLGAVSFNLENSVRAIASLIPRLTEWAECEDGKIFSFNLCFDYSNGTDRALSKDINVEVVLEGDLTNFRKLASKLSEYIAVYNKGNVLYVDVTLPEIITRAFAKFLESDKGDSIKDEILGLGDITGEELVAAIQNLSLEKIIALAEKVDVEDLYTTIMNIAQVEMVLEKIQETLGLNYRLEDIQDLNNILDEIADGLPRFTFEKVVNAISARIKVDIMKYLDKGTAFVDDKDLISKLEKIPYIGGYVAKYGSDIELNAILNQYKDAEPVEAVSDFLAKLIGKDLQKFLQSNTVNEIYDRFVEEAAERALAHKNIFERVKDYALAALNPNYVANSDWGKLAQKIIPDKFYNLLDNSIADTYKGNGKFEVGDHSMDINLGAWSDKALNLLLKYVNVGDELRGYIENLLPTSTVNFGFNFSLTLRGLSGVTFLGDEGKDDMVMFLPNGLNPAEYYNLCVPGNDVSFWVDETANPVTEIHGDVKLSAIRGFITGTGYILTIKDGHWTITADSEEFDILINLAHENANLLASANSLTFANNKGLKITMDQETLTALLASKQVLKASYYYSLNNGEISSAADGAYTYTPARVESFDVVAGGNKVEGNFTVTVPFAGATPEANGGRTNVYQIIDGKMSAEEFETDVNQGKNIVFKTTHFSDYIVVNEYLFKTVFNNNEVSATKADGYIPVGATVKIRPVLENNYGKRLTSVTYEGKDVFNTSIVMPAKTVTIECTVDTPAGNVYYDILGTIVSVNDLDKANTALNNWLSDSKNAGYKLANANNRWKEIATTSENGDVYMCANLVAIEADPTLPQATVKYNVLNANGAKIDGPIAAGATYKYTATGKAAIVYINLSTGKAIEAVNGAITMPASDVMVMVTEMVTYTVNGDEYTAVKDSIVSHNVTLSKTEALKVTAKPNDFKLASYVINADGSKTLTYTFTAKDGVAITYAKEIVSVDSYQYDVHEEAPEEKGSLLWLWILIALIVLIGLIALFYNLYINEKLKPNFMLRFITWIVSMFFNACLAVSAVVLWIGQGTTKKGEVDYEEFGMNNPENTENTEETVEAVSEETVEETTEEGDDTVAAFEEVSEEEVAVDEAVAEEVVAEEAAIEEVVAEEVVVDEAVAEEAVAEETTETTNEQN